MIYRDATNTILRLLKGFPVVTITGPRQSGKTTLAKNIFAGKQYVTLEDPDTRLRANSDPRSFLRTISDGAVIDEIQRCPELLSYLQGYVDADGRMGLFILTGSQQFGLVSGITQSLAGRSGFVELLPFSIAELRAANALPDDLNSFLYHGGYPPLYHRAVTPHDWLSAYVSSYVERDVRQVLAIQDLNTFQRFVRLCAGRSGQLLNLSSLATDCGITHTTAKAWISVLEASYILFLLHPHHANFNKRLIKSPKMYFHDVGLMAWLLGIESAKQIDTHPLRGALFETAMVSELKKTILNHGKSDRLFFWRDSNGNEVDVIIETGDLLLPVEIKSGATINRDFFSGLTKWHALAKERSSAPVLMYGGSDSFTHQGVRVLGWRDAAQACCF